MTTEPATILLVDDSEINRELWRTVLEEAGYDVRTAPDGPSALQLVDAEPIDLVLLDIMMPGMTGLQVLERMRAKRTPQELPVIMATSKDRSEDVVNAFNLGANDYVTKPLDTKITLARIRAQLRDRKPEGGPSAEAAEAQVGPGTVLRQRYRLDELLGKGNFGAVYQATHLGLQRPVAVKVLRAGFGDQTSFARFRQEGISLSRLQHPNAVAVLDYDVTADNVAYLVMERLRGISLEAELKQVGPMSPLRAAQIAVPVCEVLAEAHELGIIHRDIKPQNIFLHQSRTGETVKVLDFGIAKLVGESALAQRLTVEGSSIGTPAYMAPERFTNEPYDGRADVYSLAVTLYEMLTGRTPFHHADGNFFKLIRMHVVERPSPLRALAPEISKRLEDLVLRALAKSPNKRPTALAFGEELASVVGLEAQTARPSQLDDTFAELRAAILPDAAGSYADSDAMDASEPLMPTIEWREE